MFNPIEMQFDWKMGIKPDPQTWHGIDKGLTEWGIYHMHINVQNLNSTHDTCVFSFENIL